VRCEVQCQGELTAPSPFPFSVRSIPWKNSSLVNLCDADLIGKTLTEGKLKMHISEEFFGGELVGEDEAARIIKGSAMISLAGPNSVNLALSNKLAAPQAVREIQGVPFLMIYRF
jgi:uncharacterized protein